MLRFDAADFSPFVITLGAKWLVEPFHVLEPLCIVAKSEAFTGSQVDGVVHMEQPFYQRSSRVEHVVSQFVFPALNEFGIVYSASSTRQDVLKGFKKLDVPRFAMFGGIVVYRDAMKKKPCGRTPNF